MITLEQIEDMFSNMRAETNWNVDGVLLWGYFFTDLNPKQLERTARHLFRFGYRYVRIYRITDGHAYVLHVERAERHTPQTLHVRNEEFEKLAAQFGLDSYDGMDVGISPDLNRTSRP